ncbi:Phthalate 4,5-dioxygenase oxygenase reductase subunit [compost metagenome]
MKLMVTNIVSDTPTVKIFTLKHPLRDTLPPPSAGAHVDVRLPDGKIRQYSLCGDPSDDSIYQIAVRREDDGRGGSRWLHDNVELGSILHVSAPRNNFPLVAGADRHIFIGGGIGITPFAAMARAAQQAGEEFIVEYCVRSKGDAPLLPALSTTCSEQQLQLWVGDLGERFRAASIGAPVAGTHIYCCGPSSLVNAVREATSDWPQDQVHFEVFAATLDENFKPEPFDMTIASTGEVLRVPADKSALDVLRGRGFIVQSSCELGVCGSCECGYSDGTVIHRDAVLSVAARQDRMLLCVSRARVAVTVDF